MARRGSFNALITQMARDQAREARERERLERERQRNFLRIEKENTRLRAQLDKEAKQSYILSRIEETTNQNACLSETLDGLNNILEYTLHVDDNILFNDLKLKDQFRAFIISQELEVIRESPQIETYLNAVKKPGTFEKLIPGADKRYQQALQEAKNKFYSDQEKFVAFMADRETKIKKLRDQYDIEKQAYDTKIQQQNQEIDVFEAAYRNSDPMAISAYTTMVLEQSKYPEGFPQEFRVAYNPEPKELVIDYELPSTNIIPKIAEYRYNKSKDTIDEKLRKVSEVKEQYQDVVASVCLRTIHEVIESDQGNNILVVIFNGFVQAIDAATGRDIRPYLISVRTSKEKYAEINLGRIDKRSCLRNLGAHVSPRPDEMLPVKPIIEFDMIDKRFVEQSDILSDLEDRPNLMELTPFEFENLVSNLFENIGFQAKLTRSSKDGGVDAVAFDPRPILGGKVVIQAKRYKNVVGVSAVRDLYGTMINEGANKGILVATSHYGPDAYEFAKAKPIELIDGGGLLYLLEQQGIRARIIMPEDNA